MGLRVVLGNLVVRRKPGNGNGYEVKRKLGHRHAGKVSGRRQHVCDAVALRLRDDYLVCLLLLLWHLLLLLLLGRLLWVLLLFRILLLRSLRPVLVVNALDVFAEFVLPAGRVRAKVTFKRPLLKLKNSIIQNQILLIFIPM
jgi:hypothetical protein